MATSELKRNPNVQPGNSPANEIFAVVWAAVAILLALCLFTFHPNDPSFNSSSSQATQNFVGTIGANFATVLLQLIGLTAYLLPVVCLVLAWRSFKGEGFSTSASRVAGFLLLMSSAAALFVTLGFSDIFDRSVPAGGLVGMLFAGLLVWGLGSIGASILLVAVALVAFLLATNASLAPLVWVCVEFLGFLRQRLAELFDTFREWRERERNASQERLEKRRAYRADSGELAMETAAPAISSGKNRNSAAPSGFFARTIETISASIGSGIRRLQQPPEWVDEEPEIDAKKTTGGENGKIEIVSAKSSEKPQEGIQSLKTKIAKDDADDETDFDDAGDEIRKIPIEPLKTDDDGFVEEIAATNGNAAARPPRRTEPQTFAEYELPPSDFLNAPPPHIQQADDDLLGIAQQLTEKCKEFKANGQVVNICPGPVVTTYEYKLDSGVKFNQITKLVDDLCLGLKAESVRIDRIPGKAFVGIEVPNPRRDMIYLREVLESRPFRESNSLLTIALGKTVDGLNYVADLGKMPHLLIAGATGAGKSVGVNSLVVSILYKARPDEVKFIMVDPKQVELNLYENIPHLAAPIITDPKRAAIALKWAVVEMERRYKALAGWGVRNLDGYNDEVRRRNFVKEFNENGEPHKNLPYIVIIIDEFADLMMVARSEVEESVTRLAQKARAVGIHLVLATQRPSVDVITGLIKANFPSRISFRVSSKIDSRTIIDGSGADQLLGRGDMLFLPPGTSRLIRVHGAYVDEAEIAKIVNHVKEQGEPDFDTSITKADDEADEFGEDSNIERDELWEQALRICVEMRRASTSVLQRRLRVGYGRAAAMLDEMERAGFVGQADGASKPRPVLDKAFQTVAEWDERDATYS